MGPTVLSSLLPSRILYSCKPKRIRSGQRRKDIPNSPKVINGALKIAWEETLDANFSNEATQTDAKWDGAIDKLIIRFLNCKKPCDVQWRHHETGYTKHPFDSTNHHFRRFKESIRHTRRLPKGAKPDPSKDEVKE